MSAQGQGEIKVPKESNLEDLAGHEVMVLAFVLKGRVKHEFLAVHNVECTIDLYPERP